MWAVGLGALQGVLGVSVPALLAGAGLYTLALGLALKDTVANVVSGFVLFLNKPFEEGEEVLIDGERGTVADVNTRYVTLDTSARPKAAYEKVLIPNQSVLKSPIGSTKAKTLLGGGLTAGLGAAVPFAGPVLKGAAIAAGTFLAARLARRAARAAAERAGLDEAGVRWSGRIAGAAVWGAGALLAMAAFGVSPTALGAALGVGSAALAFAMKDLANHLVAGFMLAVYRPFKLGDEVKIAGIEGRVADITHRYVTLETEREDGLRSFEIPNEKLLTEKVYLGRKPAPPPAKPSAEAFFAAAKDAILAVDGVRSAALREDKVEGVRIVVEVEGLRTAPTIERLKKAVPGLESQPVVYESSLLRL